jgi:signal transduction histidine kinase
MAGPDRTTDDDRIAQLTRERDDAVERLEQVTRTREALLASISHDLRNPLNTFAMSAGLLRDDVEHGEMDRSRAVALLQRMERAVERMQRLIEDLVEASRVDSGKIELSTANEKVERLVRDALSSGKQLTSDRNATLVQGHVDAGASVKIDITRMAQALAKLFAYAIRIVGDGCTAVLSAKVADGTVTLAIEATPSQGSSFVPPEEGRGGLSLLLARGLVGLHGGSVVVEASNKLLITVKLPTATA